MVEDNYSAAKVILCTYVLCVSGMTEKYHVQLFYFYESSNEEIFRKLSMNKERRLKGGNCTRRRNRGG